MLGLLSGQTSIWQTVISVLFFVAFFALLPRLMIFQIIYKIKAALNDIEESTQQAETMFLNSVSDRPKPEMKEALEPMKNMVVSPPASLDPAGMFNKLEHVLDSSEDKMKDFVESLNPQMDDEELANNSMAFKGVYGSHQVYVIMRHFKNLIEDTKSLQIGQMMQMVLPLYKEISESQKDATKAFVNGVPIGDTIGPMVAASFISDEENTEEVAEDVIVAEEEFEENDYMVMKSKGPGARLGKYGDAVKKVLEDNDIDKILTVDAGMRYEGEETGTIVDGTGVMMGGPGVEKSKIEEVATDHDAPLEGFIIKQSGPEASKPMHRKIWDAREDMVAILKDEIRNSEGKVLIIGVGNTCGAGNTAESLEGLDKKLKPYWAEQEEESASYFGLMKAFPMGGGDSMEGKNTFEIFQSLVR